MAFNTTAQITTALAAVLKQAEADLATYYTRSGGLIAQGLNAAYYEVIGRLLRRGFRLNEDVLLFDRAAEFEKDIAVFWILMRSGAYSGMDQNTLKEFDRREELDSVFVFVNGVWREPAMGMPGTVTTSGPLAQDPKGVFNWEPDGDPSGHYGIQW